VPVTPFAKPSGTKPEEKKAHMAIRIKDVNTREDVRLAIQKAVRQQVQTFDALRDIEHELGFDPANLDSVVSTAASDADSDEQNQIKCASNKVRFDGGVILFFHFSSMVEFWE